MENPRYLFHVPMPQMIIFSWREGPGADSEAWPGQALQSRRGCRSQGQSQRFVQKDL